MKRRLNILCVLVTLVLSYSVFQAAYYFFVGAKIGVEMSTDADGKDGKKALDLAFNMKEIALVPEQFNFSDSVYNEKSGTYVPAMYSHMLVIVPVKANIWLMFTTHLFQTFYIFSLILAIFMFVKLIISINKSDIFLWKNVYCLRWMGGALIVSYLSAAIPLFITGYELSEVFNLRGYNLHQSELASTIALVLGIVSLIVGEIFAIGLKMKEEQDLTI